MLPKMILILMVLADDSAVLCDHTIKTLSVLSNLLSLILLCDNFTCIFFYCKNQKKIFSLHVCSLLVCVYVCVPISLFLYQIFSYDNSQPVILVQKTKQKKIRKGNDGENSKICIVWGQFFSFCPQAYQPSVTPKEPLHLLSLNTPCKWGIGNVLVPTRGQCSDGLWICRGGIRKHEEGAGNDNTRHKDNFSYIEKSFRSKETHSK